VNDETKRDQRVLELLHHFYHRHQPREGRDNNQIHNEDSSSGNISSDSINPLPSPHHPRVLIVTRSFKQVQHMNRVLAGSSWKHLFVSIDTRHNNTERNQRLLLFQPLQQGQGRGEKSILLTYDMCLNSSRYIHIHTEHTGNAGIDIYI
jgi:hypothetical protein